MNRRAALACLLGLPLAVTPRKQESSVAATLRFANGRYIKFIHYDNEPGMAQPPPLTRARFDAFVMYGKRIERENLREETQ